MVDPKKLWDDHKKANESVGDFRKQLYEIWNIHPGEYSKPIVDFAKMLWEQTNSAECIHEVQMVVFTFADKLTDYILNEWVPEKAGENEKA